MNIRITLTFLIAVCVSLSMSAQVIWGGPGDPNGEFDGGLNDWTTVGLTSLVQDSAKNSIWVWDEDATPNEGAYTSTSPVFDSPSAANGAAVFHSDFLDNAGVVDSFGTGLSPSPHSGELISPVIDLSGENAPNLTFYQRFVNFNSVTTVNVSGDGGATFTAFPINEDIDVNTSTGDRFVSINISEVAANQESVVIKFTFVGDYYLWMIDDVAIIRLPENDLTLVDSDISPFFTPHSAVQPVCAIENDPFSWSTQITNSGADTVTNMTYKVSVYKNDTDEFIFSDSIVYDSWLPGITDSVVSIVDTWLPVGLDLGIYRIEHRVFTPDNLDDFVPDDNGVNHFFEVSDMTFSKEIVGDGSIGTWPNNGNSFYAVGAFYQFGPDCIENFAISSIDYEVGRTGGDPDPLEGRDVEFWLWKLTVPLASFDFGTNYEEDILSVSHPSMEFVGFSPHTLTSADASGNLVSHTGQFFNADGDEIEPLFDSDATYLLMAHWGINGTRAPLHLFTTFNNSTTDVIYSDGWGGRFESKSAVILRMPLKIFSSVDDKPLNDSEFKVYPNPATDRLNLELNLDNASDATITVADITGKVVTIKNLSSVQSDVITIDVSSYISGTYLARVATENGTKTLKFVVN